MRDEFKVKDFETFILVFNLIPYPLSLSYYDS